MYPNVHNMLRRNCDAAQFRAIRALLASDAVVFDVGAHVGRFSVFVDRLLSGGQVHAFEPVPQTFALMEENLALNHVRRVIAHNCAIGDRTAAVEMHLFDPLYSAWNTLGRPTMLAPTGQRLRPTRSVSVPCDTIDHICLARGIERIDLLKVDVEGFEKNVFAGARRMLGEGRVGAVCFEISQEPLKGAGATARQVFACLESLGYGCWAFDESLGRFTGPVHDSADYWANFYASRRDLGTMGASLAA
jgi:FkbM family methyltransferase